jgi:hypothetical protein
VWLVLLLQAMSDELTVVVAALMMRPPLLLRVQTNAQHQTQNEIPLN